MYLKDKVALVTGAAQGIGAAIALELGRHGATIVGTGINDKDAERINANLAAAGTPGRGIVMDVRDPAQIEAGIDLIEKEFGGIFVLVNNAGITRDNLTMRMMD